jgi:hypothetical protein
MPFLPKEFPLIARCLIRIAAHFWFGHAGTPIMLKKPYYLKFFQASART